MIALWIAVHYKCGGREYGENPARARSVVNPHGSGCPEALTGCLM